MAAVRIIEAGPLTTVQDKGRIGYQKYGMPTAGAMDFFSFNVANLLVGNKDNQAVLEFTMQGMRIEFLQDTAIAITGAEAVPFKNNEPIPMWETIYVHKGSIVDIQRITNGLRGYIAFAGGINVQKVLGSRSTYLRGNIGGFNGRRLISGDLLYIGEPSTKLDFLTVRKLPRLLIPIVKEIEEIRVILGPQSDAFEKESIKTFFESIYEITEQSDRMGYRLKGPVLKHKKGADIISDAIPHGAIQVPGDGYPIILLADRQTVGGYTKIAVVINVDLNKLAQLKPGTKIKFKEVTLEQAYEALFAQERIFKQIEITSAVKKPAKIYKINISGREIVASVEDIT